MAFPTQRRSGRHLKGISASQHASFRVFALLVVTVPVAICPCDRSANTSHKQTMFALKCVISPSVLSALAKEITSKQCFQPFRSLYANTTATSSGDRHGVGICCLPPLFHCHPVKQAAIARRNHRPPHSALVVRPYQLALDEALCQRYGESQAARLPPGRHWRWHLSGTGALAISGRQRWVLTSTHFEDPPGRCR